MKEKQKIKVKAYLGIDPGKSGACAIIPDDNNYQVEVCDFKDLSTTAKTIKKWNDKYNIVANIEKVGAMPANGVVSMFTFGLNVGAYEGILSALNIPYLKTTSRKWQNNLLDKKSGKNTKEQSLATAKRLFTDVDLSKKKHDGRADALLLAYYAKINNF